ncbi:TPA: antirestriction protein, partial [Escherichia coli]|nr:antirestriction protein [Escherichia coli]
GKEGPGDRSGEAYPCINASPAKMEARHSPHTALRPHN